MTIVRKSATDRLKAGTIWKSDKKDLKKWDQNYKKTADSIEKAKISIEKAEISIEKAEVSIEKLKVSIEKPKVSIEKPKVSIEKAEDSIEKVSKTIEMRQGLNRKTLRMVIDDDGVNPVHSSSTVQSKGYSLARARFIAFSDFIEATS